MRATEAGVYKAEGGTGGAERGGKTMPFAPAAWRSRVASLGALCLALGAGAGLCAATIDVDGAGFLRDRELRTALVRVVDARAKQALDANAIEDAAVILVSALGEEGFQKPKIEIEAALAGGEQRRFTFDPTFASPLPRPLSAEKVSFHLSLGVRSHIASVAVSGLTAIDPERARGFFRNDSTLFGTERANAYSPAKVNRGVDALLGELRQAGFAEAQVRADIARDDRGAIALQVTVRQGPRWLVDGVVLQFDGPAPEGLPQPEDWRGKAWSPTLEQNLREASRQAFYHAGFPDVGVHVAADTAAADPATNSKRTDVTVTIVPGPHVVVGTVRFEGNTVTRESVLRRRVPLAAGAALDPVALERGRYRISRLGVFDAVDLHYEPQEGTTRDPVYSVREGQRYEANLLFGYGSYEQFRGGVEYRQMNILGLAHQSRLELVQSMKSTSGDYSYTVPELFGESLDGTARLFGLQRREIAFLRQEWGASATVRRPIRAWGGEASLGYTFQALRNQRNSLSTQQTDEKQVNVAALSLTLTGDRRDSPLRPRHGYHWSAQAELADPRLGGQATYQRLELAGAYHTGWGGSRWLHVGLTQGVITTLGEDNDLSLPVNKRFFPGGDNSIRGYQRGEAAPRDASGRFIGAKAYVLANVELEQALTASWSVVAFGDALGTAVALRDFPFADRLYTVGLGLRYQTLIGPIRIEYGRNVNPRPADPPGTWQIAIGYPF